MDLTTAVGRNHDTVAELQRKHPDFPADEYTAPDYAGVAFPSCVIHDFTVCQQLTLRAVADPYENKARQFLASIERGQCAPALGKGWASAELESIRAALRRMLVPPDAPVPANLASGPRTTLTERRGKRKLSMPLSVASDLSSAPVSEANSAATSAAASPLPSAAAVPGRTARANSADPLRSHTVNKAPCLLPGFTVQHQDTVSGPSELDGRPVTYCHLAELPVPGRAPRWFVGLNDRSAWVVQRTSEMLTTVPMFLDRIKGRFGLPALGLRFLEQVWLVMRDPGQGGPYATQPVGARRYDVVKWGLAGLHSLDAADWVWTEPALEQATKHLVFRALFRVTDTALATLVWSDRERKVLSWGEWSTSLEPLPTPEACPVLSNLLLCKTKQYLPVYHARDPALESLTAYWALPTTQARVRHWLDQWEPILYEIPHPPRPVHDLPTANVVLQNLAAMRAHWVDAAAVTPSTPPAP